MQANNPYSTIRRTVLAEYDVLNTPPEPAFEDITRIAAVALGAPMALISFVEDQRQWFKSEIGVGCSETSFESSICAHAILGGAFFEIDDLRLDPRTADNPLVTGTPHACYYAGAVIRTSEGIALGTVCVLDTLPRRATAVQRDILLGLARQTMALLELRRALLRAQRFEVGQSHLIATVGHDLRQPLQLITASIDLALRKPDSLEHVKRHLGNAAAATQRLDRELEKLAEAGAQFRSDIDGIELADFDFDALIGNLSPIWQSQAAQKGLHLKIAPSLVTVRSDQRMLGSIIGNLVGNAIKYTKVGVVSLELRLRAVASLEVAVLDSGIGMTTTEQDTIFRPFSQVDANSEGLGLGLSLVKRAADYLGYRIKVSSAPGIGSRFSFQIPVVSRSK